MILDLHVHSNDSHCSKLTMKQIVKHAKLQDLDGVCIVNHDIITRKFPASRIRIFIGCEITTRDGHLLTFGLNEEIPRKKPVEESIELIKEQGAISIGAHPFRNIEQVETCATELGFHDKIFNVNLDAIEIKNGRNTKHENGQAKKANEILKLPEVVGSDAHLIEEIGKIKMESMNPIENIDDLINSIKKRNLKFIF